MSEQPLASRFALLGQAPQVDGESWKACLSPKFEILPFCVEAADQMWFKQGKERRGFMLADHQQNEIQGLGTKLVYKLFRPGEWQSLEEQGSTSGSCLDVQDGYIHLSTGAQVQETARKHFADEGDLILAAFQESGLGDSLRHEPARNGQLFPHLYRKLALDDVLWNKRLKKGPDGHEFPEGLK